MVQGSFLVDAVNAKIDSSAQNTVKVTGVVTHGTVSGRICEENEINNTPVDE